MKTERFFMTLGCSQAGPTDLGLGDVPATLRGFSRAEELEGNGAYVTAIVTEGLAVYAMDRDYQNGGERVAVIVGTRNPSRSPDPFKWRAAAERIAAKMRKAYGQRTCQIEFSDVDLVYLTD